MDGVKTILITIDRDTTWEYFKHYLREHPKARSFPMCTKITEKLFEKDKVTPKLTTGGKQKTKTRSRKLTEIKRENMLYGAMSLNELLIIQNRDTMNGIKQKWGDFGLWLAKKYEIENARYSNSIIEYRVFKATKAGADCDNISAGIKFINDTLFVKSGAFIDDNYKHINPLIIGIDSDKEHPRTEIRITILPDEIKDISEKQQIHLDQWK